MSRAIYRIENLIHYYGAAKALEIEELTIERGSIVGLIGPNGSGKSTLLAILAQVLTPSGGRVELAGGERFGSPANRRRVTLLLQEPYLLKRSVLENVVYGLRARGETDRLAQRAAEALAWVGLPADEFARRPYSRLSGGEAQRVALAARLVLKPEVLLLDEPVASVDAASARLIKEASLRASREWGSTLIIASHDLNWLNEVADRIISLHQGRIAGEGPVNLLPGPWDEGPEGRVLHRLADGQTLTAPPPPENASAAVLETSALTLALEPARTPNELNRLAGRVSQLTLEGPSGRVLVSVALAGLTLTARIARPDAARLNLQPGKKVWVCFAPSAVRWV